MESIEWFNNVGTEEEQNVNDESSVRVTFAFLVNAFAIQFREVTFDVLRYFRMAEPSEKFQP